MPLTSLLLGQDSMLMLFIYAGFHNRQLARTRLDCDLRTPSLVEYPTLLLATQTYQPIVGLDPALCLISEVSYTNSEGGECQLHSPPSLWNLCRLRSWLAAKNWRDEQF